MHSATLKNHWRYSWWKYALLAAVCAMGVDMLFAMTAYRPPEDRKIELYVCNGYIDSVAFQEALWPQIVERCPDQEELTVMNIDLSGADMYATMQFSTYTAAQQGDICLLPESEFRKLTVDGAQYAYMDLSPYIDSGVISLRGIDCSPYVYRDEAGQEGVYGIPADGLFGLLDYQHDPEGGVLCVMAYNGNDENAAAVVDLLLERYLQEKPEGYDELKRENAKAQSGGTQIFR